LLFSLTLATVFHLKSNERAIKTISKITRVPGFALSTSYLENRIIYYKDSSNRLYPQMKHYKQMDYVYAQ